MSENSKKSKEAKRTWSWEENRMSPEEVKKLQERYKPGALFVSIRPKKEKKE